MKTLKVRGQTSNVAWVFLPDSTSTVGAGKTGITNASAGLVIAVRRELSAAMTVYSGANIGAVSTLGTWVDPTAGKCNVKLVDDTNAPGVIEIHFVDSLFGTGDASRKVLGYVIATGTAPAPFEIELTGVDLQDSVRGAMTALPNANANAAGGLTTFGTGTGQVNPSGGKSPATIAAGDIANDAITAAAIATDAIGSAEVAATAVTKIQSGLSTYAGGAVASVTGDVAGKVVGGGATPLSSLSTSVKADMRLIDGNTPNTASAQIGVNVVTVATDAITAAAIQASAIGIAEAPLLAHLDADVSSRSTLGGVAQTGDSFARIGAAGAGLTALGDTRLAYLTGVVALEATLTAIKGAGWSTETLAAIDGLLTAMKLNTDLVTAAPAVPGSAMTLTSGERNSVADALLDRANGVSTGYTPRQAMLKSLALAIGDREIAGGVETFHNPDGSTSVSFTLDPPGGPYTDRSRI